jgi:hypothetical protein
MKISIIPKVSFLRPEVFFNTIRILFRVRPERLQFQVFPSTSQPSRQGLVRF